jgi:hypothetical protein
MASFEDGGNETSGPIKEGNLFLNVNTLSKDHVQ